MPSATPNAFAGSAKPQESLDEWRNLTSPSAEAPRVFVKGDDIRFYFRGATGVEVFKASWSRVRVPARDYRVNSAVLRWDQRLSRMPDTERSWQEATVIAGGEWRRLATNLLAALAPQSPGHAVYYQGFLADGLLYRDPQSGPRFVPLGDQPKGVIIDHRYSTEETLEALARRLEEHLADRTPRNSLFLLMAPNESRVTNPLLLDRRRRRCVSLTPGAVIDSTERRLGTAVSMESVSAFLPESHGLALIRNPISSAARLGDLAVETTFRLLRIPFPQSKNGIPPVAQSAGMDLAQWEKWLDTYTGTRREQGTLRLLIDGDQFFPRFRQALASATNHIHLLVYIFDRDDVAVQIADELKRRSADIEVKVILDRLGSIGGGASPPATPLPEGFVPPGSIISYLKDGSRVQVRPFLDPWFSSEHSKVLLVDGARAWLGGMNLGREYRYEWHDMMVEVEGPVVRSFEREFQRDWTHAGPFGDLAYLGALLGEPGQPESSRAPGPWIDLRRLPTQTLWKPFSAAVRGSIRRARNYIYVENPYLFDKRVIANLVRARRRGVDVRVILPRVNDFKAGGRSNLVIANYLLQRGVRVYFYPGMTHVKALLVDDWACVGSGNLNHLSLRLNQEQNIATSDPAFAARLKQDLFAADFARSYELTEPVSVEWMDFLADLVLGNF